MAGRTASRWRPSATRSADRPAVQYADVAGAPVVRSHRLDLRVGNQRRRPRKLASAGFDKTVRLWNVSDGHERGRLVGHTQQVSAVAFAPDRRTVVSVGTEGTAVVWQTSTREHESDDVLRFAREAAGTSSARGLAAVGVGGAGAAFVTADDVGRVRILAADYVPPGTAPPPGPPDPLALTQLRYTVPYLKDKVSAAAASADGRSFAVAIEHGLLKSGSRPPRGSGVGRPTARAAAPSRAPGLHPHARTGPRPCVSAPPAGGSPLRTRTASACMTFARSRSRPRAGDHSVDLKGKVVLAALGVHELAFHPKQGWLAVAVGTGVQNRVCGQDAAWPTCRRRAARSESGGGSGRLRPCRRAGGNRRRQRADQTMGRRWRGPSRVQSATCRATRVRVRALAFSRGRPHAGVRWRRPSRDSVGPGGWPGRRLSLTGHADIVLKAAFNADGTKRSLPSGQTATRAVKRGRARRASRRSTSATVAPRVPPAVTLSSFH